VNAVLFYSWNRVSETVSRTNRYETFPRFRGEAARMTERLVEAPGDLVVDVIPVIDTEGDREAKRESWRGWEGGTERTEPSVEVGTQ